MKYKIAVRTIQGHILTFNTDSYRVEDGFVTFYDYKTATNKKFAVSNCEIQEGRE